MGYTLVDEKLNSTDITELVGIEQVFNEGDTGEMRVFVDGYLRDEEIAFLQYKIQSQGVVLTEPIFQDSGMVVIRFRKQIAPLLIIGGAVVAIIGSLLGWQIYRTTVAGVSLWVWAIIGGALLYWAVTSEPAKQAGGLAIQAGTVYVTKRIPRIGDKDNPYISSYSKKRKSKIRRAYLSMLKRKGEKNPGRIAYGG